MIYLEKICMNIQSCFVVQCEVTFSDCHECACVQCRLLPSALVDVIGSQRLNGVGKSCSGDVFGLHRFESN